MKSCTDLLKDAVSEVAQVVKKALESLQEPKRVPVPVAVTTSGRRIHASQTTRN